MYLQFFFFITVFYFNFKAFVWQLQLPVIDRYFKGLFLTVNKNLGVPQANENPEKAGRKSATIKYQKKSMAGSEESAELDEQSTIINMYTLPIIRYPTGIRKPGQRRRQKPMISRQERSLQCMALSQVQQSETTLSGKRDAGVQ